MSGARRTGTTALLICGEAASTSKQSVSTQDTASSSCSLRSHVAWVRTASKHAVDRPDAP